MNRLKLAATLALCISTGLVVAGCPNQGTAGASGGASTGAPTTAAGGSGSSGTGSSGGIAKLPAAKFKLVNAIIDTSNSNNAAGGSGGSGGSGGPSPDDPAPIFTLVFDANNTSNQLTDVCQGGGKDAAAAASGGSGNFNPAKACLCQYSWSLTNTSDSSVIQRTVTEPPTQVTAFEVQCNGPDVFNDPSELPDNTPIHITLIPDVKNGNSSGFQTNTLILPKQPITSTGDFRDAEGHSFRNVFHYACYDVLSKALEVKHALKTYGTNQATNTSIQAPTANDFDIDAGADAVAFSAQSYYYDFYVRSNETGSINASNSGNPSFTCPRVNIGGNPSFYPMDSSFALSLQRTADFPIAITARSFINVGGGASSGDVIGFAAKPNSDGSCPSFADSTGLIRRTYRLRQYTAIYPIRYKADGDIFDQEQPNNTIYVMDRPVDKLGQDPLKPLTRLGPKPCPFSFHTSQFGQKCMSDASLTGWNIDGTQITGMPGCPIYPPVPTKWLKTDGTLVIRPYKAFVAHYLENKSLRACAFQSSTPVDPELVLSHDDAAFPPPVGPFDFYCAKYYPPSGAIIPPPGGDPFNKAPGDCDISVTGATIKTDKSYACSRTFDSTTSQLDTPKAGCCQICSGPDCRQAGGGTTAAGRNAVFTPPQDGGNGIHNPPQAINQLQRGVPGQAGSGTCFDPYED